MTTLYDVETIANTSQELVVGLKRFLEVVEPLARRTLDRRPQCFSDLTSVCNQVHRLWSALEDQHAL